MKAIFENSLLVRAILCLCAWYHEGAIAHDGAPDGQTETVDEAVPHGGADAYDGEQRLRDRKSVV